MLTHTHNWLLSDASSAAVALKAAVVGSYEVLRNVLFWGVKAPHFHTASMRTVIREWCMVIGSVGIQPQVRSPNTPLWINHST